MLDCADSVFHWEDEGGTVLFKRLIADSFCLWRIVRSLLPAILLQSHPGFGRDGRFSW